MVEDIEKLTLKPQLHMLGQGKPFCQVEVTPQEIGTAQGIAAEVSELAVLRAVAAIALPCTRIDRRNKCVRIEPLQAFPLASHPESDDAHTAERRERHWQTAARCPARCRFRLLNRACSAPRTELRCAKTLFRKSASR